MYGTCSAVRFRAHLRRARLDTAGGIAMTFAIAMIPLFGMGALAIDYAQLMRTRSALQTALDSALMAATIDKTAYQRDSAAALQVFFDKNWHGKFGTSTPISKINLEEAEKIHASAKVDLPAGFSGVFGFTKFTVEVNSTTQFGMGNTEVALAVDNTGSMAGTKLTNLIDSAKVMVDEAYALPSAATKIKFGIVPFGQ